MTHRPIDAGQEIASIARTFRVHRWTPGRASSQIFPPASIFILGRMVVGATHRVIPVLLFRHPRPIVKPRDVDDRGKEARG